METVGTFDRTYEAKLIAEKIQNHFNNPVTGKLAEINSYVLDKINAGAGYNHVKDVVTQDPVGINTWSLPVLFTQGAGCTSYGYKRIDPQTFRIEMQRFVRSHPRCGAGYTIIGGYKFEELYAELGILDGVDSNGRNTGVELQRALGTMGRLQIDDTIDDKFGDGTFFIVENNVLAFFWLNLFNDSRYRTENWAIMNGKKVEHIKGYRETSVTPFAIGNCRDGQTLLTYDTFFNTPQTVACLDNPVFNFQFRAEYGMWTHPATGCSDWNPTTGIYKCQLADICV
jgi:hypothetical protein